MQRNFVVRERFYSIWNQCQYGEVKLEDCLSELRGAFPFDSRHLRLDTWSITQAVLVYYGIDFHVIQMALDNDEVWHFSEVIDFEHIRGLLINHLGHEVCPGHDRVCVAKFGLFLKSKGVEVPRYLEQGDESSSENASESGRKLRGTEIRKEIARYLAQLFWDKEIQDIEDDSKKSKKLTKPSELANKKFMKDVVNHINVIGDLEPHSKDVDPEWFSDIYPADNKPGPKRK